jgi:phenylpyruvate tautomerase PptA (4-oxalocrotonate tautomerase family)
MPTYNCFTAPEKLNLKQKKELAEWLTSTYHEEFGLERYLIQAIFYEVAKDDRYIAGQPVPSDVVWIRCDVRQGRSRQQKAKLLHRIRQGVAKIGNVPEEAVWIYFCDLPEENIMEWGHMMLPLRAMPENDSAWFEALPEPFKERLQALAKRPATMSTEAH